MCFCEKPTINGTAPVKTCFEYPAILGAMDSTARYWMLATIHAAHRDGASNAREKESYRWKEAAAEKRIKTRKQPARGVVKVWIEPRLSK